MWHQLFKKLLADEKMIYFSSNKKAEYGLITTIIITLNIYNPFNVFVNVNTLEFFLFVYISELENRKNVSQHVQSMKESL